LIGLRFNSEKKQGARNDLTSDQNDTKLEGAAKRLATEYKVGEATIKRSVAAAVDTIASNVGPKPVQPSSSVTAA
jgi:hypothetical protein